MPNLNRQCVACFASFLIALPLSSSFAQDKQSAKPPAKTSRAALQNYGTIKAEFDIVYASYGDRDLHLDLFTPKRANKTKRPCVVVVHGGGWLKGDKSKFQPMAEAFAARGYIAANVEYRLGGEAKFPAGVQDCFGAVRFLRANADRLGIDADKIGAVGGSAGGHIVGLMATASEANDFSHEAHADASAKIHSAVVMAGPMDLADGFVAQRSREHPKQSNSNQWIGKTVDEAPDVYKLASPIRHIDTNTAPIFYQCGEYEDPKSFDESRKKLNALGIQSQVRTYKYGKHGCWNQHPWFDIIVEDADAFLQSSMSAKPHANYQITKQDWGTLHRDGNQLHLKIKSAKSMGLGVKIPAYHCRIGKVLLRGDESLEMNCTPGTDHWRISVSDAKLASTLENDPAEVDIELLDKPVSFDLPIIVAAENNKITLNAYQGNPKGELIRFEPQPHKNTIGYWAGKKDSVTWYMLVEQPGKYKVRLLQGCGKDNGGSQVVLSSGDNKLDYTVTETGHFQNFQWYEAGELELGEGVQDFTISIKKLANVAIMDVRQVELVKID